MGQVCAAIDRSKGKIRMLWFSSQLGGGVSFLEAEEWGGGDWKGLKTGGVGIRPSAH